MSELLKKGFVIAERYEIIEHVGAGGMQDVYRAKDRSLRRNVALKTPKNDSAEKRFQRSAAVSAKITHPNVAKTFDYLTFENTQYLIEEYVSGDDLKSRLDEEFIFLDPDLAAHVFHHIVKGMAAVHSVRVLHRDLKPSNIMVSVDPDISVVKITDFGIARMAEVEIEEGLQDDDSTMASATVMGALPFMAPEVMKNSKDADLPADVWSAGAVLFHLLAGESPYGGGVGVVAKVLAGKPPKKPERLVGASSEFEQLCNELWELIIDCLQHDPDKRPTARQLVERCGQLCYSRAPRCVGTIRQFGEGNGKWGFIRCHDDAEDAFFHRNSYWGKVPKAERRVLLARFPGRPSSRAHPVLPLRKAEFEEP